MTESLAEILERPADDLARFDQLVRLLNEPGNRLDLEDLIEDAIRRESGHVAAKMFSHARFYAELTEREWRRMFGKSPLDSRTEIIEDLQGVIQGIDYALSQDDGALLAQYSSCLAAPLAAKGRPVLGVAVYDKLLSKAEEIGNRLMQIRAGTGYGRFLYITGRLEEAYSVYQHTLELAQQEGNEWALGRLLHAFGNVTVAMGKYAEARAHYTKQLEIARTLNIDTEKVFALGCLAWLADREMRLDDAKLLLKESLVISRKNGSKHLISIYLTMLGDVATQQGDYDNARRLLHEAAELNRQTGSRNMEGFIAEVLGKIALDQGHFDEAKRLYSNAHSIATDMGDIRQIAYCENELGAAASATECNEDACRHFKNSIEIARETGYMDLLPDFLVPLGALHCDLGEYTAAESVFSEAMSISRDQGMAHRISAASRGLALVALMTGKLPEATESMIQAVSLAAQANAPRGTLLTLHVGVLLLAKADKAISAALVAFGINHHLERIGLVFSKKWHRDLDEAMARCSSMLDAEELRRLEQQAESMSIEDLTAYALEEVGKLKLELDSQQD